MAHWMECVGRETELAWVIGLRLYPRSCWHQRVLSAFHVLDHPAADRRMLGDHSLLDNWSEGAVCSHPAGSHCRPTALNAGTEVSAGYLSARFGLLSNLNLKLLVAARYCMQAFLHLLANPLRYQSESFAIYFEFWQLFSLIQVSDWACLCCCCCCTFALLRICSIMLFVNLFVLSSLGIHSIVCSCVNLSNRNPF